MRHFALILLFLSACECKTEMSNKEQTQSENAYLNLLYQRAVRDAMDPAPEEVEMNLTSIGEAQDTTIKDTLYVKMVSLVSGEHLRSYQNALKSDKAYPIGFNGFYTIVPELKEAFKEEGNYGDELLSVRLMQILGLPYQKTYSYFVEFWIKKEDIRRPCPDSDPNDTSCQPNFPDSVNVEYRKWFNETRFTIYESSSNEDYPFPFTQLGYTYDWGGLKDEKGLSEFVVLGKIWPTRGYVASVQTIQDYLTEQ